MVIVHNEVEPKMAIIKKKDQEKNGTVHNNSNTLVCFRLPSEENAMISKSQKSGDKTSHKISQF